MKAVVYYNNSDVRFEEVAKPTIAAGEMLVKVTASGICGSDVLEWYRMKKAPIVLGHEIAAEIVEVGQAIKNYQVGQRVFVSHHIPCNTCRYCLAGNHTACHTLHTTNFDPGGFAEYVRVPKLNVDRGLFLLPAEVSDEEATFIEPLACVLRGQRVANFKPGQTVLVLGSGISGLLHIALAKAQGAGKIIATDISDFRLKAAKRFGANQVIRAAQNVSQLIKEDNEGKLADLAIVCTGAKPAFEQALNSVDRGGTIQCFAALDPGITLDLPVNEFWRNAITINSSYGAAPNDLAQTIELLKNKRVNVAQMITHRFPLSEAQKAFDLVAKADDSIKVILRP